MDLNICFMFVFFTSSNDWGVPKKNSFCKKRQVDVNKGSTFQSSIFIKIKKKKIKKTVLDYNQSLLCHLVHWEQNEIERG